MMVWDRDSQAPECHKYSERRLGEVVLVSAAARLKAAACQIAVRHKHLVKPPLKGGAAVAFEFGLIRIDLRRS